MEEKMIAQLSTFFKVFGDESRLKILFLLKMRSYKVNDIAKELSISQSAISHQLQLLRQLDLVKVERKGKEIFYSLSDHHINMILEVGTEHIKEENND